MDAFLDESNSGIFCAIGGEDTIRILPYGINIELDCDKKTIVILENSTIET